MKVLSNHIQALMPVDKPDFLKYLSQLPAYHSTMEEDGNTLLISFKHEGTEFGRIEVEEWEGEHGTEQTATYYIQRWDGRNK